MSKVKFIEILVVKFNFCDIICTSVKAEPYYRVPTDQGNQGKI